MPGRVFLLLLFSLSALVVVTSPPVLRPFIQSPPSPTPTLVAPTFTSTPTAPPDPFATVPTATPFNQNAILPAQPLPVPTLGQVLPTVQVVTNATQGKILPAPTSAGLPPKRQRRPQREVTLTAPNRTPRPVSGLGGFFTSQQATPIIPERVPCSRRDLLTPSFQCRWSLLWNVLKRQFGEVQRQLTLSASINQPQAPEPPLMGWPVKGRISQRFGCSPYYTGVRASHCPAATAWFHDGLDIATPPGTPVQAAITGTVIFAGADATGPACGQYRGYGLSVVVDNGNGWRVLYAHLSRIKVSVGQRVSPETIIGTVGATGCVSGPHLHFGLRYRGKLVNPELMLVP